VGIRLLVVLACLCTPRVAAAHAQQAPRPAASARDTARTTLPAADTARRAPIGAPVVVQGDTVLYIPTRLGSFSAADRAAAVALRVQLLAHANTDSIQLVPAETATDLVSGATIIMTVTDADAAAAGRTRAELAEEFSAALLAKMKSTSLAVTIKTIAFGLLWTLLATAVLAVLLVLLGRLFPRLYVSIEARRRTMPALRIQKFELLSADSIADTFLGAARLLRALIVVILLYFYLPLVLSFFPRTQQLSREIIGYAVSPLVQVGQSLLAFLPNLFFIAVIVVVTRYALKVIRLVFLAIGRGHIVPGGFDPEWAEPTYKIVRFLTLAFALVILFPYLPGSKSDAFKGVSVFIGVLFSLGSSSAISNVVAGVVLTYTRAFRIGDRVKVADTMGDVVSRSLLVTRVRTIKNVDVTIPNALVLGNHIQNFSAMAKQDGLILHTGVTIGYDVPWKQVHTLLLAAADATAGLLKRPEPFVLQTSLDDFYVSYEINACTDDPSVMAQTYSQLHANIQDKFNEAGVEIMSPHYANLRDGNQTTIPADHLPKNYTAPPFRVDRAGP